MTASSGVGSGESVAAGGEAVGSAVESGVAVPDGDGVAVGVVTAVGDAVGTGVAVAVDPGVVVTVEVGSGVAVGDAVELDAPGPLVPPAVEEPPDEPEVESDSTVTEAVAESFALETVAV